ncbi:hypothetical protein ACHAXT_010910 [Thalassiosira profunda]
MKLPPTRPKASAAAAAAGGGGKAPLRPLSAEADGKTSSKVGRFLLRRRRRTTTDTLPDSDSDLSLRSSADYAATCHESRPARSCFAASSIKTADSDTRCDDSKPPPSAPKSVSFGTVRIREYETVLADGPALHGPPVGIGWDYHSTIAASSVDAHQAQRDACGPRLTMWELRLAPGERAAMLLRCGVSMGEIHLAVTRARQEHEKQMGEYPLPLILVEGIERLSAGIYGLRESVRRVNERRREWGAGPRSSWRERRRDSLDFTEHISPATAIHARASRRATL